MLLQNYTGGIFPQAARKADKLNEVIKFINKNYVDTISRDALVEKSIDGLLLQLDPHSVYITAPSFMT